MINLQELLIDTKKTRDRMWDLWDKFDVGKVKGPDARVKIGIARTILDGYKVQIAAAHLDSSTLEPTVILQPKRNGLRLSQR
jgi:hypothetical protein